MIVFKFYFLFYALLTALVVKKQSYLVLNLLYFSKRSPKTNLKDFQYQILTSVKRLEK